MLIKDILRESVSYTFEADSPYNQLSDKYPSGPTEIWFTKPQFKTMLSKGFKNAQQRNVNIDLDNLSGSHILIGKVNVDDPKEVYAMMQGEIWSPQGEGEKLVKNLGLNHTSMNIGDIVKINNDIYMVDIDGLINLMKPDEKLMTNEDLRKWFKEKWVRFGPDGKIRGDCARGDDSEGKPKCLPQSKAHALGKKRRAAAAAKKRREDPNPERKGAAKNVATKVREEQIDEKCWDGYRKEGTKKMFGKTVPNCVKNEDQIKESCPHCGGMMLPETALNEKKDACYYKVKSRYKVWPSAYASGALVQCRKKGAKNWGKS